MPFRRQLPSSGRLRQTWTKLAVAIFLCQFVVTSTTDAAKISREPKTAIPKKNLDQKSPKDPRNSDCGDIPCFVSFNEKLERDLSTKNCKNSPNARAYENRLKIPYVVLPHALLNQVACLTPVDNFTFVTKIADVVSLRLPPNHGGMRACIARSLQRSHMIPANEFRKCESELSKPVAQKLILCPTTRLVDFLYFWFSQAFSCMNPSGYQNKLERPLKLRPEFVFSIINHESTFNLNLQQGLMQMTEVFIEETQRPSNRIKRFWEYAKNSSPICKEFEDDLKEKLSMPHPKLGTCSLISPEGVGRHMILGLGGLLACQEHAEKLMAKEKPPWRLEDHLKSAQPRATDMGPTELEKSKEMLMAICHNWGINSMERILEGIMPDGTTFQDSTAFRKALESERAKQNISIGTDDYLTRLEKDLELVKKSSTNLDMPEIKSCEDE